MTIDSPDDRTVREMAQLELIEMTNLLSLHLGYPVSDSRISSISAEQNTASGKARMTTLAVSITTDAILAERQSIDSAQSNEITDLLAKKYPEDAHAILDAWRQALKCESQSQALSYLMLYRLLESLIGDTDKITSWIQSKEPGAQMCPRERGKKDCTYYTLLRDNIHPREKQFPFKEIEQALPKLRKLVQLAIKERYTI